MKIFHKVAIGSAVIFAAIGFQTFMLLKSSRVEHSIAETMEYNVEAFSATSALIHELQKERGKSSLLLGGGLSSKDLETQRTQSDAFVEPLRSSLAHGTIDSASIHEALAALDSLRIVRAGVDRQEDAAKIRTAYSSLIRHLFKIETAAANAKTTRGVGKSLTTMVLLETAKESSGQLRALMSNLLAVNKPLNEEQKAQLFRLKASIDGSINSPALILSKQNAGKIKEFSSNPNWIEVERVYQILIQKSDSGNYGIQGKAFFDVITHKIDDLASLVTTEKEPIKLLSDQVYQESSRAFWGTLLVAVITAVAMMMAVLLVYRRLLVPLGQVGQAMRSIAQGSLDVRIDIAGNDEVSEMQRSMQVMIETQKHFLTSLELMAEQQRKGDMNSSLEQDQFQGIYRNLASEINQMVSDNLDRTQKTLHCFEEFGRGNFSAKLEKFPGDLVYINKIVEKVRLQLESLVDDADALLLAALSGHLDVRANASRHHGDFRKVVQGINDTLDAMINPVQVLQSCLSVIASGDLTSYVRAEFKGDHDLLKQALNATLDSLNDLMEVVQTTSFSVQQGSKELAAASQTVAQGSTEAAASIEEISAAVAELSEQTERNALGASQADQLAEQAKISAISGNEQMLQMVKAMEEIEFSSRNISKIIKVIDEIAFQTNLLALNAAVEAARAGVHGKGFAVVAEEVRSLAARSAKAAKETTTLIETSTNKVSAGTQIARLTQASLGEIGKNALSVSSLVREIRLASQEQNAGFQQIKKGIAQLDAVTQQNSASAEETAASAEQLNLSVRTLSDKVAQFKTIARQQQGGVLQIESSPYLDTNIEDFFS